MRLRRNPPSITDEAKYFQYQIVNALAGFPSGLRGLDQAEQMRLMTFLERVINTTAQASVQSPHKTYSSSGSDPTLLPPKPQAITPPAHVSNYLSSDEKLNRLEQKARIGNQRAILDYLEILDFQDELELENLWVVPFTATPYDIDGPDGWIFVPPFPYSLGDDLKTIEKFCEQYYLSCDPIRGAFVVDIGTLELSDIVGYNLSNAFSYLTQPVDPHNISVSAKYYILQAEAILIIDNEGWHFPQAHEIGQIPSRIRQSKKYWELKHREKYPGKKIRGAGPIQTRWPEKLVRQLPVAQFPERAPGAPYVIVVHKSSGQAFALDGGYSLLDEDVNEETILHAMRYNRSSQEGWLPTAPDQLPEWTKKLLVREPSTNFISYWVAE